MILLAKESPFTGFQGEGNSQGNNSTFIRFIGCNCSCKDCDTPYAWKNGKIESTKWELNDIVDKIRSSNTTNIIYTGGEPIGLTKNFDDSILITDSLLKQYSRYTFEYETNGVIDDYDVDSVMDKIEKNLSRYKTQFNISPKFNFEQEKNNQTYPNLLDILFDINWNGYIVKFLFDSDEDIEAIEEFQFERTIPTQKIWVQPKGIDAETLKNISLKYYDTIIKNGWNLSLRSHIFLFGNKKGV